jgi:hypothetical protein
MIPVWLCSTVIKLLALIVDNISLGSSNLFSVCMYVTIIYQYIM